MKSIQSLILLCIAVATFTSCTIEQEVHFHENFSGDYQMKFDMSELMPVLQDSVQFDSIFSNENTLALQKRYENIQGITNPRVTFSDGIFLSKFSFADMTALNKAINDEDDDKNASFFSYRLAKNAMIIDIDTEGLSKLNKDSKNKEGLSSDGAGGDLFKFKAKIKFDKPIKSVKGKLATFDSAANAVTFDFNITDVKEKSKKFKTVVKFK
jgi:hypothetical protein